MKKANLPQITTLLSVLLFTSLLGLAFPQMASAENALNFGQQRSSKLAPTPPMTFAMVFSKLTKKIPDFDAWVRTTPIYNESKDFEKPNILKQMSKQMESMFLLLAVQEPLIIDMPVKLSSYSTKHKGFFIESFKSDTFFPLQFAGKNYALIPQGLMDKQWIGMEDPAVVKAVEDAIKRNESGLLTMSVFILPQYADDAAPAEIEGVKYWMMAVNIDNMKLYPVNEDKLLWTSESVKAVDEKHNELLNLKQ